MLSLLAREPVVSAIVALVAAALALLAAFGVSLTEGQVAAITGLVTAALAIAGVVRAAVEPLVNRDDPAA